MALGIYKTDILFILMQAHVDDCLGSYPECFALKGLPNYYNPIAMRVGRSRPRLKIQTLF